MLYTCAGCTAKDRALDVPAREAESVTDWMDRTINLIAEDHRQRAPRCQATVLQEVKIPTNYRDRIGGPVVQ